MKLLRQYIFKFLHWIEHHYYSLSYWPRHITGILIVLLVLGTVCMTGYGLYRGVSYIICSAVEYISDTFIGTDVTENNDPTASSDEYSRPGFSHYKFPLSAGDRHPKRRPNYHKDFSHLNDVHLAAARRLGVSPLKSREEIAKLKDKLVELHDTRYYKIDKLTQSVPYLVPKAADFLTDLGKLMQEYNGTSSRYIITSVMRTEEDVKRLRRGNTNASENSAHRYATTIDITYNRFDVHGKTYEGKLKEDLGKALYDMQEKGYCYVKYEVKQACYHITVRP